MPLKHVQKTFNNSFQLQLDYDGAPLSLDAVTRMVLRFDGSDVVADSDVDPLLIQWSGREAGNILFNINDLDVRGGQKGELILYDFGHQSGQVAVSPDIHNIVFNFV